MGTRRYPPRRASAGTENRGAKKTYLQRGKATERENIYREEYFVLHLAEAAEPRDEARALEPRPRAPHVRRAQRPRPACRVVLSAGG